MCSDKWLPRVSERDALNILAEPNLILRNLKITWCYHELANDLRRLFGDENASWCAIAAWASRTAGYSIRNEVLPAHLTRLLEHTTEYRAAMNHLENHLSGVAGEGKPPSNHLAAYLQETFVRLSDFISEGNRLVFEELGPLYARFVHSFERAKTYDRQALTDFTAQLKPGPPEEDGQDMLKQAFEAYYRALFEKGKTQAELIFLGNLLAGLDEQTRLQEPIVAALNAPLDHSLGNHLRVSLQNGAAPDLVNRAVSGARRIRTRIKEIIAGTWRSAATEVLMSYRLPEKTLRLGEDVRPTLRGMFPEELREIVHPQARALLKRWDRTWNTTEGSAACDWGQLADRMNYIVDLFRAYQQDQTLYQSPYSTRQIADIRNGKVPRPPL